MKYPTRLLFVPLLICFSSGFVRAENYFVNWGGDYLDQEASGQLLDLGPDSTISDAEGNMLGVGFSFDETQPLSPLAERYNKDKSSAVFYGVLQVMNPGLFDDGDPARLLKRMSQVKALARKNAIGFGSGPAKDDQSTGITGMVYWQKEDFLQGSEAKISWPMLQSLSVDVMSINARGGAGSIRFAIRNGNTWYLSEDEQKKGGPFVLHDSSWGEWKIEAGAFPLPEIPVEFATSSAQLTNITALGVFFHAESFTGGTNAVFSFRSFQVASQP